MAEMKPETIELLSWAEGWMRERGYTVQDRTPWTNNASTVLFALDDDGGRAFGVLAHQITTEQLARRLVRFMHLVPRPVVVYIFLPRNAPHNIEVKLKGKYRWKIVLIEAPDYGYAQKHYDSDPWESSFSVRMWKRDFEPKG